MSWITEIQASAFLGDNPRWESFENKDELLQLASNRLEQLVFKDETINRVDVRYVDGESGSKTLSVTEHRMESNAGNWDYHEALGWTRYQTDMKLAVKYEQTTFNVLRFVTNQDYSFKRSLSLKEIQSLHSFGGTLSGRIALDFYKGMQGSLSTLQTDQAFAIVDKDGEQVFDDTFEADANRMLSTAFGHDQTHVFLTDDFEFGFLLTLDGVNTVEVINEQGDTVINTVPLVLPAEYFTYKTKVIDGLDKTMYLYVNDVLVRNPLFGRNVEETDGNRLTHGSGDRSGFRQSYMSGFGTDINLANPSTIPIRLVGACALLALEYGKFPPTFVGDKEYLENENDYNRMQDLPVNVQAAVEPFLADYESVVDIDGVATTAVRGMPVVEDEVKMLNLQYY